MIRHTPRSLTPGKQPSRAPHHSHAVRDWTRRCLFGAAGGVLTVLVVACSSLTCHPAPVTVAQKDERSRLEMVSTGAFTSETGYLKEVRVPEVVREYWVRAEDGTWYRVSAEQFRAVEVGGTLELCR